MLLTGLAPGIAEAIPDGAVAEELRLRLRDQEAASAGVSTSSASARGADGRRRDGARRPCASGAPNPHVAAQQPAVAPVMASPSPVPL
jgi:hypothetical protein